MTSQQFESLDPKSRYELLEYDKKIDLENEKIIKWRDKKDVALSEIDLIEDFLFSGTDALLKADQSVSKSMEKTQSELKQKYGAMQSDFNQIAMDFRVQQ